MPGPLPGPLTDEDLDAVKRWAPDRGFPRYKDGTLLPRKQRVAREEFIRSAVPGLIARLDAAEAEPDRYRAVVKRISELSPGHEYMAIGIALDALAEPEEA